MKGIIYIRVSSDEQVQGTSLDSQESKCRAYCADKNVQVEHVFREEGESAKTADRTELLKALDYCRKHRGKIAAFVVYKVDRFARNAEDHFAVKSRLLKYGTKLHSATEAIGDDPVSKLLETMLAGYSV